MLDVICSVHTLAISKIPKNHKKIIFNYYCAHVFLTNQLYFAITVVNVASYIAIGLMR